MKLSDVKTGDSFGFRGNSFVSKVILNTMKYWGKRHGYNVDKLYSHFGRAVWIANKLYIFGSIDSGYKPWLFELHYDWELDDFIIMRRTKELVIIEEIDTTHFCMHLTTINLFYQYLALLQWLILVYLRINTFKNHPSNDFTYCYRAELMCRADLNPENYKQTSVVDVFMLRDDPNYEIIYSSKP